MLEKIFAQNFSHPPLRLFIFVECTKFSYFMQKINSRFRDSKIKNEKEKKKGKIIWFGL